MTVAERYAKATSSSHLRLQDRPTDADVLIASGWATGSMLVQTLWRMRHSGKPIGFHGVVSELNEWLREESLRKGIKSGGEKRKLKVIEPALFWWLNKTCRHCEGRGHPNFEGTPVMNEEVDCPECHGEGVAKLSEVVRPEFLPAATLLLSHVERSMDEVEHQIKVSLKG